MTTQSELDEVRRYRLSYKNGVIEDDGSPRDCQDSMPMVLASDHDRIVSSLQARIEAAEKRVNLLEGELASVDGLCRQLIAHDLEVAVDKADAKRYRWLRDQCSDVDVREGFGWLGQNGGIDAAIDSAIQGEG